MMTGTNMVWRLVVFVQGDGKKMLKKLSCKEREWKENKEIEEKK